MRIVPDDRDEAGYAAGMDVTINGEKATLAERTTVAEMLETRGLSRKPCAVEVNKQLVPKAEQGETRLAAGDRVEIVTLVGGG